MACWAGNELHALLLDLDDTILDNRKGLREAWDLVAEIVASRRPELEFDAVREQIVRSTRWFWSDLERRRWGGLDLPRSRLVVVRHLLGAFGCSDAALAAEAASRYTEHRERAIEPLPGALESLERLRHLVPRLGLVTNGAMLPQRAKIERFELAGYFDAIVIEGEFGAGKPEARIFEHALRVLEAAPAHSLMAGDNYEADVLGALRAGLHAVWIDREGSAGPPLVPPRPHQTVRSIVELEAIIAA